MRHFSLAVATVLGICGASQAQTIFPAAMPQGMLCRSAIAAAERGSGIPANLLAAIGRVESGRSDPVSRVVHPWPWTVNAEGQGSFYDTKAQAIAAVRAIQARGVQSIDVGCGQINLMHHPSAFPSLEVAFDPQANASYAARILKELFTQAGDWTRAAARYHSGTPELADQYRLKVLAVWPEEQRFAGLAETTPLAQAWGATMTTPPPSFTRMQASGTAQAARIIMQPSIGGMPPPGRGLDAYRAAPIGLAYQPPPRRIGG